MVTQVQIAQHVGLDVSSVNKILNKRQGPVFKKETVKRVFKVARELGFSFDRLKHVHRRRRARKTVDIPTEVVIYSADGQLFDNGKAVIRDLSPSGAQISGLILSKGVLPLQPFSVALRFRTSATSNEMAVRGQVVRLKFLQEAASFGISFHSSA